MSFIYISHRLEEIARIADRVVVMRDGRMVGPPRRPPQVPVRTLVEDMVGRSVDRHVPAPSPRAEGSEVPARSRT